MVFRYEPRNILITGGAGFIASHVVELFCYKYPSYKIVVLDSLEYCSSMQNLDSVVGCASFKFVQGSILSPDLVKHVVAVEEIDTVIHFAAETHVDNSFGNSFAFTETNVIGTHILLEVSRLSKTVKRFLHVSTDEVYGESSFLCDASNLESASVLSPTNPYSASKAAAEMLVLAYSTSYNVPYIITRGNNVYGPRQFPEKAIPKFINRLKMNKSIPIHGNGTSLRSYMHVRDAASAFDHVLHLGEDNNVYNIGAHEERSVLSVAEDVCSLMGRNPSSCIEHVADRPFNDRRYFVDCSKLEKLGWSQEISWEDGLRETVEWYLDIDSDYWKDIEAVLHAHAPASIQRLKTLSSAKK